MKRFQNTENMKDTISFQYLPSKNFPLIFQNILKFSNFKKVVLEFGIFVGKKILLKSYGTCFHILETPHFLKAKTWISVDVPLCFGERRKLSASREVTT